MRESRAQAACLREYQEAEEERLAVEHQAGEQLADEQRSIPFVFAPVINLPDLGINAGAFRSGYLNIESDRYISVIDLAPDGIPQLVTSTCCRTV